MMTNWQVDEEEFFFPDFDEEVQQELNRIDIDIDSREGVELTPNSSHHHETGRTQNKINNDEDMEQDLNKVDDDTIVTSASLVSSIAGVDNRPAQPPSTRKIQRAFYNTFSLFYSSS